MADLMTVGKGLRKPSMSKKEVAKRRRQGKSPMKKAMLKGKYPKDQGMSSKKRDSGKKKKKQKETEYHSLEDQRDLDATVKRVMKDYRKKQKETEYHSPEDQRGLEYIIKGPDYEYHSPRDQRDLKYIIKEYNRASKKKRKRQTEGK